MTKYVQFLQDVSWIPGLPGGSPGPDRAALPSLQGARQGDVVIGRERFLARTLASLEAQDDPGDVPGPLGLQLRTHVKDRPAMEVMQQVGAARGNAVEEAWEESAISNLLCWSISEALMPLLRSVLMIST